LIVDAAHQGIERPLLIEQLPVLGQDHLIGLDEEIAAVAVDHQSAPAYIAERQIHPHDGRYPHGTGQDGGMGVGPALEGDHTAQKLPRDLGEYGGGHLVGDQHHRLSYGELLGFVLHQPADEPLGDVFHIG